MILLSRKIKSHAKKMNMLYKIDEITPLIANVF